VSLKVTGNITTQYIRIMCEKLLSATSLVTDIIADGQLVGI